MDKNFLCGREQGKFLMRGGDVSWDRDRDGKYAPSSTCPVTSLSMSTNALHSFSWLIRVLCKLNGLQSYSNYREKAWFIFAITHELNWNERRARVFISSWTSTVPTSMDTGGPYNYCDFCYGSSFMIHRPSQHISVKCATLGIWGCL